MGFADRTNPTGGEATRGFARQSVRWRLPRSSTARGLHVSRLSPVSDKRLASEASRIPSDPGERPNGIRYLASKMSAFVRVVLVERPTKSLMRWRRLIGSRQTQKARVVSHHEDDLGSITIWSVGNEVVAVASSWLPRRGCEHRHLLYPPSGRVGRGSGRGGFCCAAIEAISTTRLATPPLRKGDSVVRRY